MDLTNLTSKPEKTPEWLREVAILAKSWSYCCPKCDEEPPDGADWPHQYEVDGDKWPMVYDYHYYNTIDGYGYDWNEYHKCLKCKTIYYYYNGT